MKTVQTTLLLLCPALCLLGCGGGLSSEADVANATGDAMANLDEASIGSSLASRELPLMQLPSFLKPDLKHQVLDALFPSAYAASCWIAPFSACANGVESRTFSSCNIGPYSLDGTVSLTFSDTTCAMDAAQDSVTRMGNFTVTGFAGGSLVVSSPGGGQELIDNGGGSFSYSVPGMERVATAPDGKELFDISSDTSSPIGVSGLTRATRVVNGGTLVITHNILKYTASLTPENLTWASTCNCPVAGTWTGSLSGSRTGSYSLELTGCGTAELTVGTASESVELDRCGAL